MNSTLASGRLRSWGCTLILGWLSLCAALSQAGTVDLGIPQGALQGAPSERSADVAVFKNIPYARPPVGQRRFRHAEPAPDWEGQRLATDFSPACLQRPYPTNSFYARAATPTSEDCLYLNVWAPIAALHTETAQSTPNADSGAAPSAKRPAALPVMVWIHGGGLTRGSGSIATYEGTALAAKGVVLVTINYRLGVFGYLAHPEASAESSFGVSGNYGTSDQIEALKWVQRNISAFGGDPDNVTIFGESAGSWSVHHLLASPRSKNLFHKAIGQSGARFGRMPELRGDATSAHAQGVKLQTMLGVDNLAGLRSMDAADILDASGSMRFSGVRDGVFFPEQFYEMFAGHRYNQVPLLLGYNAHEGTTLGGLQRLPASPAEFKARVERQFGAHSADILAEYPASQPRFSSLALMRDTLFGHGMHTLARFNSQREKDTYFYYFTHAPYGEPLGAFHAAEIMYAFGNAEATMQERAGEPDRRLNALMADYWVAFATNGRPVVEGAPKWPRYTARKARHMEFSAAGAVPGRDALGGRFDALNRYYLSLIK